MKKLFKIGAYLIFTSFIFSHITLFMHMFDLNEKLIHIFFYFAFFMYLNGLLVFAFILKKN
jgi:ABC-type antimicrobial peptide transport system permease subunit